MRPWALFLNSHLCCIRLLFTSPYSRSSETLILDSVSTMKGGRPTSGDARKSDGRLATKKAPEKRKTGSRKVKDPNKPKRPPSAFFVFMDQFRKEFKEKNPENKLVSVVGKAGGNKWKSMSDAEKAPYVAKADKLKDEYQRKMRVYDGSEVEKKNAAEDESSDKSKSEVSEEGAGSDEEEEDD